MAEEWLSIIEYSRSFNISDMTVRRRIKTGRLYAVLREGKYYIPVGGDDSQIQSSGQFKEPSVRNSVAVGEKVVAKNQTNVESCTGASWDQIPREISDSFTSVDQASVDAKPLLDYCNEVVNKLNEAKDHLAELYKTKKASYETQIELLQNHLKNKDNHIKELKQQVDDLQLLVKIVEQSS